VPRISIAIGIDVDTGKLTDRRAMDTRPSRGADAGLDRGQQACTIGDFSETAGGSAIANAAGTVTAQQAVAKPDHRAIVDAAVDTLARELAGLAGTTDTTLVVVGGNLGLYDPYREILTSAVGEHATLEVVPAALGENAVVVGAALAAIRRL